MFIASESPGTGDTPPAPDRIYERAIHGPAEPYPFSLEFLARVEVNLARQPQVVGKTPEGLKISWTYRNGIMRGPKLNATLENFGADWLTIRPDGIAVLGVRAILRTPDDALITTTYSGFMDLGETGYNDFLRGHPTSRATIRSAPKLLTGHHKYLWINHLQYIGIGAAEMDNLFVAYDLYAVR